VKLSPLVVIVFLFFYIPKIRYGGDRKMDYRLAAEVCRNLRLTKSDAIVIQTHDLIPLFTYYYDRDLFNNKDRSKSSILNPRGIFTADLVNEIERFPLENKERIVLLQTFQKQEDNLVLDEYFRSIGYSEWTTKGISGVRVSVFFKKRPSS
jgi:hypothetical protein